MTIKISSDSLFFALTSSPQEDVTWYLNIKTGEIEMVSLLIQALDEFEEAMERMEDNPDFVCLPQLESHEEFKVMEDFTRELEDTHKEAKDALFLALEKRRPFRHFKDALYDYPDLQQRWYTYHEEHVAREAREFLDSLDIDYEIVEGIR